MLACGHLKLFGLDVACLHLVRCNDVCLCLFMSPLIREMLAPITDIAKACIFVDFGCMVRTWGLFNSIAAIEAGGCISNLCLIRLRERADVEAACSVAGIAGVVGSVDGQKADDT